ncbi:MAG TPA: NAD(P)/FAD-dependent oxidoreductase [Mycobacteriales bacterium]|nr:NAD(P)/FAD-dependent oxidoreductase [Mycobacteriales bacterium]
MTAAADALVIGAGPNGLVAANLLADAGWDVLVLEAKPEPGGAVKSAQVTSPGFVSDLYSSFYPLALGSPVMRDLHLEEQGLRWRHAPQVLAHPLLDGRAAVLSRDLETTAASVGAFHPSDAQAWRDLAEEWQELSPHLVESLMRPFPPVRPAARVVRRLGAAGSLRFARFMTLSVRRFAEERFTGEGAGLLLAGNAMHTDLSPEAPGSALFGWLLAMLGQHVGFPVPEGGAGELTRALVSRLESRGGRLECSAAVDQVLVEDGRVTGVRVADGRVLRARAVLADVPAPVLYRDLLGGDLLPSRLRDDLDRFAWDDGTVKVDWALSGPIPWRASEVHGAGTVHVAGDLGDVSRFGHELENDLLPSQPFLLLGQMTTADPTRSPAGTESAWAYTHVPQHARGDAAGVLTGDLTDPAQQQLFLDRVEARVEQFAPGFRDLVTGRHVAFPQDLQSGDANLVGGALNGGTSGLHQQLFLRPTPGLGRPETFVAGLYLASASAHPGGGVHGACGANAARAALRARTTGRLVLPLTRRLAGAGRPASRAAGPRSAAASRRSGP